MRLVATVSDKGADGYNKITLPLIMKYAEKCHAEFMNFDQPYEGGEGFWNYRTMLFYDLLEERDEIFYIDSDTIIDKYCPDIFKLVPDGMMAGVFEDKGSRKKQRLETIQKMKEFFGCDFEFNSGFLNGGVYLVRKEHRAIFQKINGKLWGGFGFDSGHLSYQMAAYKIPFFDLGYKWNHMTMFSEDWNNNANRFESNIIHYAGKGIFDKDVKTRIEQIEKDYKKIYG